MSSDFTNELTKKNALTVAFIFLLTIETWKSVKLVIPKIKTIRQLGAGNLDD